eukprot:8728867-Alexandrium_andersonii.AAC.1
MGPRQSCCLGLLDPGLDAGRDDPHGRHRVCLRGRARGCPLCPCQGVCSAQQLRGRGGEGADVDRTRSGVCCACGR